jgi:hypothetical protein
VAEVAEPLGVARDGDAPVGQVQIVESECLDGRPPGGVDGGRCNDQPLVAHFAQVGAIIATADSADKAEIYRCVVHLLEPVRTGSG